MVVGFPAASVAAATTEFAPGANVNEQLKRFPLTVAAPPLHVTPATPERASVIVPVALMDDMKKRAPSAGEVRVKTGGVLSMLMPCEVAGELTLSALSVHVPVADWFMPSVLNVAGTEQSRIPESVTVPVNVTVTSVRFHPTVFG